MSKPPWQFQYQPSVSSRGNNCIFYNLEIFSEDRRPPETLDMYEQKVAS